MADVVVMLLVHTIVKHMQSYVHVILAIQTLALDQRLSVLVIFAI